jgi:WD40 repeat protein
MSATIYKMSPVPIIGQSIDSLDSTSHGYLEVLASLKNGEDQEVTKMLWQPNDGNKVVTVNSDSRINVWDLSSECRVQVHSFKYFVQFVSLQFWNS